MANQPCCPTIGYEVNVRELATIAFGFRGHGTIMSIKVSFDGSGKEDDHPVMTVAGYFADEKICGAIELDWIRATGGKVFHFTDFGTEHCKLGSGSWTEKDRSTFLKRLGAIVNREGVEVISHSVEVAEYKSFLSKTSYADIYGPAYSTLAIWSLYAAETILNNRGMLLEEVEYVFEKGERVHELTKTLADMESGRGSRIKNSRSHHFLPKDTALLQPADLIAGITQRLLLRASNALKCLSNGCAFTPVSNFERYYSKDGVTASVIPPTATVFRSVVNRPAFGKYDEITVEAVTKFPDILKSRRKARVNQGKKKRSRE